MNKNINDPNLFKAGSMEMFSVKSATSLLRSSTLEA
jgi:hypothetical protein